MEKEDTTAKDKGDGDKQTDRFDRKHGWIVLD
jgi:hypothetical protein